MPRTSQQKASVGFSRRHAIGPADGLEQLRCRRMAGQDPPIGQHEGWSALDSRLQAQVEILGDRVCAGRGIHGLAPHGTIVCRVAMLGAPNAFCLARGPRAEAVTGKEQVSHLDAIRCEHGEIGVQPLALGTVDVAEHVDDMLDLALGAVGKQ